MACRRFVRTPSESGHGVSLRMNLWWHQEPVERLTMDIEASGEQEHFVAPSVWKLPFRSCLDQALECLRLRSAKQRPFFLRALEHGGRAYAAGHRSSRHNVPVGSVPLLRPRRPAQCDDGAGLGSLLQDGLVVPSGVRPGISSLRHDVASGQAYSIQLRPSDSIDAVASHDLRLELEGIRAGSTKFRSTPNKTFPLDAVRSILQQFGDGAIVEGASAQLELSFFEFVPTVEHD